MSLTYALRKELHSLSSGSVHGPERAIKWERVVAGMIQGSLKIGSRAPITGVPAYLTPEVLHGGFASGELLAGGELQPFEHELAAELKLQRATRRLLNESFLKSGGLQLLHALNDTGQYELNVPEEGAFLTVEWLLDHDKEAEALDILRQISPHFDKARFYPRPSASQLGLDPLCSLSTVSEAKTTVANMRARNNALRYAVNKIAVSQVQPAYDELVSLVLATCRTEKLSFVPFKDSLGSAARDALLAVERRLLECDREVCQLRKHSLRLLRPGGNARVLLEAAKSYLVKKRVPNRRSCNFVSAILRQLRDESRRGLPLPFSGRPPQAAPETLAKFRQQQQESVAKDFYHITSEWRLLALDRLKLRCNEQEGLNQTEQLLVPVTRAESRKWSGLRQGNSPPAAVIRCFRSLQKDGFDTFLQRGQIPSMDVAAKLFDQIIGTLSSHGVSDVTLRRLSGAMFTAFRRRRSLLLLNLESQVQWKELPWVPALEAACSSARRGAGDNEQMRDLLGFVARLCLVRWPGSLVPNKMVSTINALAGQAELQTVCPSWPGLTEELAADIFMGRFQPRWELHARTAEELLRGTLYDAYYGRLCQPHAERGEVRSSTTSNALWTSHCSSGGHEPAFEEVCARMTNRQNAGLPCTSSLVRSGQVVEMSMVLTTHNYAVLVKLLTAMHKQLNERELVEACHKAYAQVMATLRPFFLEPRTRNRSTLKSRKNGAYGLRQLVVLVSLLPDAAADEFFSDVLREDRMQAYPEAQRLLLHDLHDVKCWHSTRSPVPHTRLPFTGWKQQSLRTAAQ